MNSKQENRGLYRTRFEHDNCGIGAVVNSKGIKSHTTVENALKIVENLEHRAGKVAEEAKENMELPNSFFHRTNCSAIRQKKCLKLL